MKNSIDQELQRALNDLYHNGTLPLFENPSDDDFTNDLFDEFLRTDIEEALEAAKMIEEPILQYGEVYQWGRGGRTVAPERLIEQKGGGSFRIKRVEDLNLEDDADKIKLLKILNDFNSAVRLWCSDLEARFEDYLDANDLRKEIEANKGKKRKSVVVYR